MWWNPVLVWSMWELELKNFWMMIFKSVKNDWEWATVDSNSLEVVKFYQENKLYQTTKWFYVNKKTIGHWVDDMMAMNDTWCKTVFQLANTCDLAWVLISAGYWACCQLSRQSHARGWHDSSVCGHGHAHSEVHIHVYMYFLKYILPYHLFNN